MTRYLVRLRYKPSGATDRYVVTSRNPQDAIKRAITQVAKHTETKRDDWDAPYGASEYK